MYTSNIIKYTPPKKKKGKPVMLKKGCVLLVYMTSPCNCYDLNFLKISIIIPLSW